MNQKSKKHIKILIVDDDDIDREKLQRLLRTSEDIIFDVNIAASGKEGFERYQSESPECIFIDYRLPDMTGIDFVHHVKSICQGRACDVPIVMLTGQGDEHIAVQAMKAGCYDYLTKDEVNEHILLKTINESLSKNQLLRTIDEQSKLISKMAYYDTLTGIYNRNAFMNHLEESLSISKRRKKRLGVLMLDIDNFKSINDSFGHNVGDIFLKVFCNRIQDALRREDLFARLGGDEFVVLIEGDKEVLNHESIAEKIIGLMNKPFIVEGKELVVTVSIGFTSTCISQKYDKELLLKQADIAMYEAKHLGKNRYVSYDVRLDNIVKRRISIQNELATAIPHHQFKLAYQPIIDIRNNKIKSLEALIRWHHPSKGVIMPDAFISLAEHSGQIISIGEWVIKEACRQFDIWQKKFGKLSFSISINLSAYQLSDVNLIDFIVTTLRSRQMPVDNIEFELTESAIVNNIDMLKKMKGLNIRLILDDFGTGYSSLSILKALPISSIKIDKSFVKDLSSARDIAIVKTIINLSQELKIDVIVEGVESENQLKVIKDVGCPYVQGFYYYKPLTPAQVETVLGGGALAQ